MDAMKTNMKTAALGIVSSIAVASALNTAISLAAQGLGASPSTVIGLQPMAYITLTALGVIAAAAGWTLIHAKAKNPKSLLAKLVPSVLVLSLFADIPLFFIDGASVVGVVALMLMHIVVAAVVVPVFARTLPVSDHETDRVPGPTPAVTEKLSQGTA
ncbi:DUF6069 family protein [Saccharopolyspora sp. NPDC002686]|uniref:DUF6069 family protein n=1 Tax=Saccharopolyspora sp. NPDC002686 TaxID=3154541 RepID=UPI003325C510